MSPQVWKLFLISISYIQGENVEPPKEVPWLTRVMVRHWCVQEEIMGNGSFDYLFPRQNEYDYRAPYDVAIKALRDRYKDLKDAPHTWEMPGLWRFRYPQKYCVDIVNEIYTREWWWREHKLGFPQANEPEKDAYLIYLSELRDYYQHVRGIAENEYGVVVLRLDLKWLREHLSEHDYWTATLPSLP